MPGQAVLTLRNARTWEDGLLSRRDLAVAGGRVTAVGAPGAVGRGDREVDLEERVLLPGLVNGHDHLDLSTFPPLGRPPYVSAQEWAGALVGEPAAARALGVPLADRLFLGGVRNLLSGVTAVVHHGPFHRSLARSGFPVRVLARYGFAHSPRLTPHLRKTYRTTDRRIPWFVHVAEGTDEQSRGELAALIDANVLRPNTVVIHGVGLGAEDAARMAEAQACLVWCPEANRRLYGATAPLSLFRSAGVRVGLGSDSPLTGARDALSNLAAARGEGLGEVELMALATRETAEVARLPVGGFLVGAPADFVAVDAWERLLEGDRRTLSLVVAAGRPLYGTPSLMDAAAPGGLGMVVEGQVRRIDKDVGRKLQRLLTAHPGLAAPWLLGISFPPDPAGKPPDEARA
ncbi:MAG TPA: amidohydrolase family protein [Vicinamibacteria bacterium]|nr:amidohydrolase family protein [Vicinamibacteria bacterium]